MPESFSAFLAVSFGVINGTISFCSRGASEQLKEDKEMFSCVYNRITKARSVSLILI